MKTKRVMFAGLVAVSVLAGCSSAQPSADEHANHAAHHQEKTANGDIRETTASLSVLPAFLETVDPQIKQIYQIAAQNIDLLKNIPCYCGCGESAGHQHNGNCFIHEVKSDGSVVWDDHGTRCGTCMEIAFLSSKLKSEGKSVKEIRKFIDERYKEGYAKPTPTPMPS